MGKANISPAKRFRGQFSLNSRLWGIILAIWGTIILCVLGLSYHFQGQSLWKGWEIRDGGWCEHQQTTEFIQERSNSWSDVSFLLLGLWMISKAAFDEFSRRKSKLLIPGVDISLHQEYKWNELCKTNSLVAFPWISAINGFYNCFHAFGTFWYHSCGCFHGHNFDAAGMLTVTSFPFSYVLFTKLVRRVKIQQESTQASLFFGLWMTLLFSVYYTLSLFHYLPTLPLELTMVAILLIDGICILWYLSDDTLVSQPWYFIWGMVALGIGFILQRLDNMKILCFPHSLFQGHALWHMLCATTLYCIYMLFRTTKPRYKSTTQPQQLFEQPSSMWMNA